MLMKLLQRTSSLPRRSQNTRRACRTPSSLASLVLWCRSTAVIYTAAILSSDHFALPIIHYHWQRPLKDSLWMTAMIRKARLVTHSQPADGISFIVISSQN